MGGNFKMGLKPVNHPYSLTPFTKVNGNTILNLHFAGYLLPSALADDFYKLQQVLALAPFGFLQKKRLSQFICLFIAVKSGDVDRLLESNDLSACEVPDNVNKI
jgi:hypothetical protein